MGFRVWGLVHRGSAGFQACLSECLPNVLVSSQNQSSIIKVVGIRV